MEHALLVLFSRQTEDERNAAATIQHNGMGFTPFDADIFSSFARFILKSTRPDGQRLTVGQLNVCRKLNAKGVMRIAKYAGQLADEANNLRLPRKMAA